MPSPLLAQVGAAAPTAALTYLRLGHTPWPQLAPIARLTTLRRIHLHVAAATVRPLAQLTQLTYLHLRGHCEDLPRVLPRLPRLQKLVLAKARRVAAADVAAMGRLRALTALELPASKHAPLFRSVAPLASLTVRLWTRPKPRVGIE